MSKQGKHSPEPWAPLDGEWQIADSNGELVADVFGAGDPENPTPNRRRIVACVNACAGLPTEALESGALGKALRSIPVLLAAVNGSPFPNHVTLEAADALRALGRLP